MKSVKANKPVDFNELPCPPGYGPIPGVNAAADQPADPQEMAQMVMCLISTQLILIDVKNKNIIDFTIYI